MLASDVLGDVRSALNEPNPDGRFTDADLLGKLSIAVKEVTRDILFPTSSGWFNTAIGVQEYQLIEVLRIYQVYYAGELLPRTDTLTLEGYQQQFYDNTASGGGPAGSVNTNTAAPTLYQTQVAPQWSAAPAQAAPVLDGAGTSFATSAATPWFPGRRPVWYANGGNLGIVPAPAGAVPVMIRAVREPAQITVDTQALTLPDNARQCLMWRVIYYCYVSDRGQEAQALRQEANQSYLTELKEVRHWRATYDGTNRGINLLTERGARRWRGNERY